MDDVVLTFRQLVAYFRMCSVVASDIVTAPRDDPNNREWAIPG